ncbi:MAG: hypothetical protein ABI612_18840 [Betaproteobacteria bacterium]
MKLFNSLPLPGVIAAGLVAAALSLSLPARAAVLDFDAVASGTLANAAAPAGISFVGAVFLPDVDAFGDDIPGTEKWRADPDAPAVTVDDPNDFSFANAPSPKNVLNARFGPVLLQFASPYTLASFSTILDRSSFGSLVSLDIEFLDVLGRVLKTLATEQSVPGYVAALTAPIGGVSAILLPGGAFYDNISVPEANSSAAAATLVTLAGWQVRRRLALRS